MITTREFMRKTKRGSIIKVVREHYLRDDLFCGSEICTCCEQNQIILSREPNIKSNLFPFPHYIVLDTNIILDQIDVLEEDIICNIIILTTVLDEVKHKSPSVYKRFKDIIGNSQRKIYVFVNEHHKDTYVERKRAETANDRNDRAIRTATKWYDEHLKISQQSGDDENMDRIRVILVTDDAGNRTKAQCEGILSASIEEYVASLVDHSQLLDKISRKTYDTEKEKLALFPPHLSNFDIHKGIKSGKLLQGSFMASRENYLEGSVNVEGYEKYILIQGKDCLNRAIDGDVVAIELFSEDLWSAPSEVVLQDEDHDPGDNIFDNETEIVQKISVNVVEKTPTGRIVGIIRRKWRQYCGILEVNAIQGATRHIFVPAEKKIPKVRIETRQADKLINQRIIVAIDSWPRYSRYPNGHFVRALGPIGDIETENEVLLLEHDVPHAKFSEDVCNCLPKLPWIITKEDYAKREDLRDLYICSVDPPGCTDIDDALHCRQLEDGFLEVGVHIADVSHFIRPGTALDDEAALRGTTVYLIGKRIDMVPDLLSSNLCSLRGGVERFAFSCIWKMDQNANIINTKFHKSVIQSKKAMTYEEAQCIIDDTSQNDQIAFSLRNLNKLAKILKKRRLDNGALVLASPEIRFQVDSETHDPIEVESKKIRETNSMVEEFMLLANVSVAEYIFKEFPECSILRRHPRPPQSNFEPLIKAARNLGFEIKTETGKDLATSLDNAVKSENPYFNTMLRIIATRCMLQAVYFVSGTTEKEEFFHYGLAAEIYTHFTSPIRRYSDIMVHRLLAASIGADGTFSEMLNKNKCVKICENLNYRHRQAQYAGRASVALNTHLFFRGKTEEEEGYVLFVRKNALQILIPKFGLEGTIFVNNPKNNSSKTSKPLFTFNEDDHTLSCGNIVFHAFDPVTIRLSLDSTNVQREKLVFELVKPYIEGFSVKPSTEIQSQETETLSKNNKNEDDTKLVKKAKIKEESKQQKKKKKKY